MIIVRVELLSAITGETTEMARMHICNEGGTPRSGNYGVYTLTGRSKDQLDLSTTTRRYTRTGKIVGHPRLSEHVWNLVGKALNAAGYKHE